eukprot:CAMPEP_0117446020 /NCGR_PEP_ID=MMETSP0759-20121206/6111_1 /TAXON_ID=63605 /ORGANISM="Percolomonas cosmopolitus, Strain WS" /LENGTH=343 /DNA_ID=CAMNT_0005238245 /DNA_START=13 /DNA_END=1044 /DNA_ORIENTATION=+
MSPTQDPQQQSSQSTRLQLTSPILKHLSKFPLSRVLKKQKVVTLPDDATIARALETLSKNKIRSAPVLNTRSKDHPERILGIIGTVDICYYMLEIAPNPNTMTRRELNNFFIEGSEISSQKVYKILDRSGLNPVETFVSTSNLPNIVTICLSKGVHRVLILESGEVVATVSRSDIVRLLWTEIHNEKPDPLTKQFADLPIKGTVVHQQKDIVTCKTNDPVLLVLDKLRDAGHKSLPIVDNEGRVVDNFSSSEVSGLVRDAWPSFGDNAADFKKHVYELKGEKVPPLVFTKMNATVGEVIEKLVGGKNSIHVLWVVDDNMKPIGSISLTDILRFAVHWEPEESE